MVLCGKPLSQLSRTCPIFSAISLATLLFFIQPTPPASADTLLRLKPGRTSLRVRGQFTKKNPERYYAVYARAGQHMRVEIIPLTANLHTEGNVKFPRSELEPGNPGGVVFDEQLPEDGMYRIRVGQRFN